MIKSPLSHIDFWDVGQADCTVLNFVDGGVLIIDTGLRGSPIVDWLANKPRPIRGIVLTHNDADHSGALCSIVAAQGHMIERIYLLRDRPTNDKTVGKLFRCAVDWEKRGCGILEELRTGMTLWGNDGLSLNVIHPTLSDAITANNPNENSAILVIQENDQFLVVWPGDISLPRLTGKLQGKSPHFLMGPHHGAPEGYKCKPDSVHQVKAIAPKRAFISVGSKNSYSHPAPRYLQMLTRMDCHVVCSQLTRNCDPRNRDRPVFNGTGLLGLPAPRGGTACRGSWRLYFRGGQLIPDEHDADHLAAVAELRRPHCRYSKGAWKIKID